MQLEDLCKGVYKSCPKLTSQDKFVEELFKAAGGNPYLSKSNAKQLFSGAKPFNENQKAPLRGKNNVSSLTTFFEENISSERLDSVISAFGIPESGAPNKKALATALAMQTRAIIESQAEGADDIILMEYQRAKSEPTAEESQRVLTPRYPGDSAWSEFKPQQSYKANCYEKVSHTWIIHNTGSQTWQGRKLVLTNHDRVRPRAEDNSIDIPDAVPAALIKINISIDARGFEGKSDLEWEMQDAEGNNCFPNNKRMFYIYIETVFNQ